MDCVPIGKKIVTLSIQVHGTIIDLNLSPEIHSLFNNTRIFSYAGIYSFAYYSMSDASHRMREMQNMFARDIYDKTMVDQLNEYMTPIADEYRNELAKRGDYAPEKIQNVCKFIGANTIDKALAKGSKNLITKACHLFVGDTEDIYAISVHEKTGEYAYKLLSEPKDTYRGICYLSFFREKGRDDIADLLVAESTVLPDFTSAKNAVDAIEKDTSLSPQEKESRIDAIKEPIYREIQQWKCTVKDNEVISIRLSMLMRVLKMLYGEDCYFQIIDYSCDETTMFLPKEQYSYKQYRKYPDIEQGIIPDIMGGQGTTKGTTKGTIKGTIKGTTKPERRNLRRKKNTRKRRVSRNKTKTKHNTA